MQTRELGKAPKKPHQDLNFTQTEIQQEDIMKASTRDEAEGTLHQVKGKIKEIAGKVTMNPDLEAEGKDEMFAGKAQEKIGQVEKVLGK